MIARLIDGLGRCARSYIDITLGPDIGISSIDAWANVHRVSQWHGPHSHYSGGGETASGVYWVKIPSAPEHDDGHGVLVFADPRGPYHPGRYKKVVHPTEGHAVIFPSWQQHYVNPIADGDLRISVGFDVICHRIIP